MGISIQYRSLHPVGAEQADAVRDAAHEANAGRTWLSCEPVFFYPKEVAKSDHLLGSSKPNLSPHPDDVEAASRMDLPDGGFQDVLEILCQLSREFQIDWEIQNDFVPNSVSYIRDGACDSNLNDLAETISDVSQFLEELESGGLMEEGEEGLKDVEDSGPHILRF